MLEGIGKPGSLSGAPCLCLRGIKSLKDDDARLDGSLTPEAALEPW